MTGTQSKYGRALPLAILVLVVGTLLLRQLPAWRVDLTEESLFSLSDGTVNIVSSLQQPLTLQLYFSESVAKDFPQLMDYGQRVSDLLAEYVALNPDNLKLEVIDPEPFSEAEDNATAAGITGAPVSLGGESFYLGLSVSRDSVVQGDDAQEVIGFFSPERETFLEYDISQLIYRVGQNTRPVVGVFSKLQVLGGFDFRSGRTTPAWMAIEQLKGFADVKSVAADEGAIDSDLDVLLVVHPQELSELELYAIDQYVLSGGKALVFVDPHAEVSVQQPGVPSPSEFERLLSSWGVAFDAGQIVGDRQWALRIPTATSQVPMPHVGIAGLQGDSLSDDSLVTAELEVINISSAGSLAPVADAGTEFVPLLQTSPYSKQFETAQYISTRDHGALLNDFEDSGEPMTIAAIVRGAASSAFTERPAAPESKEGQQEGQSDSEAASDATPVAEHRSTSESGINVLLVSDVDMISDRLWVQVSNFMGQRMAMPWASNGDFVANAVELLAGSDDLIGLRSRGQYSRTFTVVNDLRVEAAEQFKQQEQNLQQQLADLEAKISSMSPDTNADNEPVLSAEQERAIKEFEAQRLQVRKQLRQVQHQLNSSIDSLESRLKIINIFLVPVLLIALLLVLRLRRGRS